MRFIVTGVPVEEIDRSLKPGDLTLIARTKDAYVYENPRALPRVMVVHDYRIADFDELIRRGWPDVDPRRTVLLEHAPAPATPDAAPIPGAAGMPDESTSARESPRAGSMPAAAGYGAARILRYANTEIDVEVAESRSAASRPQRCLHPRWRAEVTMVGRHPRGHCAVPRHCGGAGLHHVHFAEPLRGASTSFGKGRHSVAKRP